MLVVFPPIYGYNFVAPLKENLVKHQKVSKYYENDCLQNFLSLFMSLLTAKFVKSSGI